MPFEVGFIIWQIFDGQFLTVDFLFVLHLCLVARNSLLYAVGCGSVGIVHQFHKYKLPMAVFLFVGQQHRMRSCATPSKTIKDDAVLAGGNVKNTL